MKRHSLNKAKTSAYLPKFFCRKSAGIIFTGLFFIAAFSANAVTYSSATDGAWNIASTRTCSCIPPTNTSDTIVITHNITFNGNYSHASTSHLYINNGGSLNITGTYSNMWSNSMLRIASGGAMSASSITFTGNASPVYRIDRLLSSRSASGNISFFGDRQVNFSLPADVRSARDILVGTTNSSGVHTFNGRFSGRNFTTSNHL